MWANGVVNNQTGPSLTFHCCSIESLGWCGSFDRMGPFLIGWIDCATLSSLYWVYGFWDFFFQAISPIINRDLRWKGLALLLKSWQSNERVSSFFVFNCFFFFIVGTSNGPVSIRWRRIFAEFDWILIGSSGFVLRRFLPSFYGRFRLFITIT